jgi:hypothetical protein
LTFSIYTPLSDMACSIKCRCGVVEYSAAMARSRTGSRRLSCKASMSRGQRSSRESPAVFKDSSRSTANHSGGGCSGKRTLRNRTGWFSLAADGVHLEPHPVEHPVLVRILTLRRAGLGGRRIAATLTAEGHQPRGVAWNPGNLQVLADRLMAEGMGLGRAGTSTCTTPRTPTARSSGGRFSPTTATSRLAASPRVCSCIFP